MVLLFSLFSKYFSLVQVVLLRRLVTAGYYHFRRKPSNFYSGGEISKVEYRRSEKKEAFQ
jgi:hypothetical protein